MCLISLVPQPEQQQLTSMMFDHGQEAVLCVMSKWRKQAEAWCHPSSCHGVAWGATVLNGLFSANWERQVVALLVAAALQSIPSLHSHDSATHVK